MSEDTQKQRTADGDWAERLQQEIDRDMARIYSPRVLKLWRDPRNAGSLDEPDGYAAINGPCGDTMQIWLRVRDEVITDATFWTDGCGTSVVCASMVTVMAKGRAPAQAVRLEADELLDELGGLPEDDRHCATLAVNTLRASLATLRRSSGGSDSKEEK